MSQSGAPQGNQNAVKAKRWQQAIDRALAKRSKADGIEALDALAEKFLDEVEAAGIPGYRELGDRMDGKAAQSIVGDFNVTARAVEMSDDELAEIAARASDSA